MKFLTSKELDIEKFDALVSSDNKNNVFCYSWYLSSTSTKWGAIVNENYTFALPLAYKNRVLFKQFFQHPFSRNVDFFGDEKMLPKAVEIIKSFVIFHFNFPHLLPFKRNKRVFQNLLLKEEIIYKKNAQRIISKNESKFQYKFTNDTQNVLKFYFENSFNKIKQQAKNKLFFRQMVNQAIKHGKGQTLEVWENNCCIAAAFFLLDKQTVLYIMGDCDIENKKRGVMFSLMNEAILKYKSSFEIFDFGGSNVESVSTFYKKMGGKDCEYFEYKKKLF